MTKKIKEQIIADLDKFPNVTLKEFLIICGLDNQISLCVCRGVQGQIYKFKWCDISAKEYKIISQYYDWYVFGININDNSISVFINEEKDKAWDNEVRKTI